MTQSNKKCILEIILNCSITYKLIKKEKRRRRSYVLKAIWTRQPLDYVKTKVGILIKFFSDDREILSDITQIIFSSQLSKATSNILDL